MNTKQPFTDKTQSQALNSSPKRHVPGFGFAWKEGEGKVHAGLEEDRKLGSDKRIHGCQPRFSVSVIFPHGASGWDREEGALVSLEELGAPKETPSAWNKEMYSRKATVHKRWGHQISCKSRLPRADPFTQTLILHFPLLFHLRCTLPAFKFSHLHLKVSSPRNTALGGNVSCCLCAHWAGSCPPVHPGTTRYSPFFCRESQEAASLTAALHLKAPR